MSDNQPINISNDMHKNYHYCPKCNERLRAVTLENTVKPKWNDKSKNYLDGSKMKAYRTEFHCPKCRLKFSLSDLKRIDLKSRR